MRKAVGIVIAVSVFVLLVDLSPQARAVGSASCVDCVDNGSGGKNCETVTGSGGTSCSVDGSGQQCVVRGICSSSAN